MQGKRTQKMTRRQFCDQTSPSRQTLRENYENCSEVTVRNRFDQLEISACPNISSECCATCSTNGNCTNVKWLEPSIMTRCQPAAKSSRSPAARNSTSLFGGRTSSTGTLMPSGRYLPSNPLQAS